MHAHVVYPFPTQPHFSLILLKLKTFTLSSLTTGSLHTSYSQHRLLNLLRRILGCVRISDLQLRVRRTKESVCEENERHGRIYGAELEISCFKSNPRSQFSSHSTQGPPFHPKFLISTIAKTIRQQCKRPEEIVTVRTETGVARIVD